MEPLNHEKATLPVVDKLTLRQIVAAFKGEIAWMRVYPDGQRAKYESCMSWDEIQHMVYAFGDRTVWKVCPGYGHILVYLDK